MSCGLLRISGTFFSVDVDDEESIRESKPRSRSCGARLQYRDASVRIQREEQFLEELAIRMQTLPQRRGQKSVDIGHHTITQTTTCETLESVGVDSSKELSPVDDDWEEESEEEDRIFDQILCFGFYCSRTYSSVFSQSRSVYSSRQKRQSSLVVDERQPTNPIPRNCQWEQSRVQTSMQQSLPVTYSSQGSGMYSLMLKNIPYGVKNEEFIDVIKYHFGSAGVLASVNLPASRFTKNKFTNKGYGFVSFLTAKAAANFACQVSGAKWPNHGSTKVLEIRAASQHEHCQSSQLDITATVSTA